MTCRTILSCNVQEQGACPFHEAAEYDGYNWYCHNGSSKAMAPHILQPGTGRFINDDAGSLTFEMHV
jgi:hypothetical protein